MAEVRKQETSDEAYEANKDMIDAVVKEPHDEEKHREQVAAYYGAKRGELSEVYRKISETFGNPSNDLIQTVREKKGTVVDPESMLGISADAYDALRAFVEAEDRVEANHNAGTNVLSKREENERAKRTNALLEEIKKI